MLQRHALTDSDTDRARRLIVLALVLWMLALSLFVMLPDGSYA